MKKLALIGAMNRDLVAMVPGAEVLARIGIDAQPLLETAVSDALAETGAALLEGLGGKTYLGGSAFNVARLIGLLNAIEPCVSARFLGLVGRVEGAYPHLDALEHWGVEHGSVELGLVPPATCLAMVEPEGRTLLTALGVNADIARYIERQRLAISTELAATDLVHITSFLDEAVPGLLASVVAQSKANNPALKLSLDPGSAWVVQSGEGFAALLRQTDILHVNHEELDHLTKDGKLGIGEVGAQLNQLGWMIVSRHHTHVVIYQGVGREVLSEQAMEPVDLPEAVLDATGAGDTFCGSFLWAFMRGDAPIAAARFAFSVARAKVCMEGPATAELIKGVMAQRS